MRCDAAPWETKGLSLSFNPHTYMRCDTAAGVTITQAKVSIHTPTWGVTLQLRSRGAAHHVSIHTPTWGVTSSHHRQAHHRRVSIHTPTWGVTTVRRGYSWKGKRFNPHTYMRCDKTVVFEGLYRQVSIHTPTWGVTTCPSSVVLITRSFNPHTYMRCDRLMLFVDFNPVKFQSTHLHEVWLIVCFL